MSEATHHAIVVGAGVAGLAAAGELARLGLEQGRLTALVDDGYLGGLITNVGAVDGAPEGMGATGGDIVNALLEAALEAGADYRMGAAESLVRDGELWRLPDLDLAAPAVVLATGARLRRLGVAGEEALAGRGVSQCAFCDGGLYRGESVYVVGGGDAAFQEALHLAELCGEVTLLIRGDAPRARAAYRERAAGHANLHVQTNVEVLEIVGADGVEALRVAGPDGEATLPTRAVFPFVGLEPAADLAPAEAARDGEGALLTDAHMATSLPGLYAIGAVRAGHGGEIAHAIADATAAAARIAGG